MNLGFKPDASSGPLDEGCVCVCVLLLRKMQKGVWCKVYGMSCCRTSSVQAHHSDEICTGNYLVLNMEKTEEMMFDPKASGGPIWH